MGFLDTNNTDQNEPLLAAGTHNVTLTKLKWVLSRDKGIAKFADAAGNVFTEWLNAESDGQKTRTRIFVQHVCTLSGVEYRSPDGVADFDALGEELVAKKTPLEIRLIGEEYNGQVRAKLAAKRFDECLFGGDAVSDLDAF